MSASLVRKSLQIVDPSFNTNPGHKNKNKKGKEVFGIVPQNHKFIAKRRRKGEKGKMELYNLQERKQIIKWHHQNNTVRQVRELFAETFENRPVPSLSTLHRVIKNFERYGCIFLSQHKKSPVINDNREMLEIMVCHTVNENPTYSAAKIAETLNSSATTVKRILKKNGYHSYKVK